MAKSPVEDIDRHIGCRLKKLRQQHDKTASQVADAIGSSQQQVSRYENGLNKISAAQLYALSCYFGVPISWFFVGTDSTAYETVGESGGSYNVQRISDDLEIIKSRWSALSEAKRTAVLNLIDAVVG